MAKSIKQKTRNTLISIFIGIIGIVALFGIFAGYSRSEQLLERRTTRAAVQVSKIIDIQTIEAITWGMGSSWEAYKRLEAGLYFYRKALELKNLYVMTENRNHEFVCLIDGKNIESTDDSMGSKVEIDGMDIELYKDAMGGKKVSHVVSKGGMFGKRATAYIPVKNEEGKVVGFIVAAMENSGVRQMIPNQILWPVIALTVVLIIIFTLTWYFTNRLTDPIVKLRDYSLKEMGGWQPDNVASSTKDEIGQLAEFMNNRIDAIRNILNNTGEGLMTFDSSMQINREYSNECLRIFNNRRIEYYKFPELLFPDDMEEKSFIEGTLGRIFQEKDSLRRNAYLSLLPEELDISGRSIRLDYKIIADAVNNRDIMMVILTDITEKRQLENKIETERNTLNAVIRIMSNYHDFSSLVNNYHIFADVETNELLASGKPVREVLYELYGKIHTFKGDFGIYGTKNIVSMLHEFEEQLSDIKKDKTLDLQKLRAYLHKAGLKSWLDKDLEQLSQIIGVDMVDEIIGSGNSIVVEEFKLGRLEKYIRETLDNNDSDKVLKQMRKLSFKPIKSMMRLYPDYVEQLANKLNKAVDRLEISGGEFMVDEVKYRRLIDALVHVFRNAVDHGIEESDDRVACNKLEKGTVKCSIELQDKLMTIIISDDGGGIDLDAVREKAIELGVRTVKQLSSMNEEEQMQLIFAEEFSTKENSTELSGRGIGLPAVTQELEKLGGSIRVISCMGKGTSFVITVPEVEAEFEAQGDCFGDEKANTAS